jgi:hypothetical protein
MSMYSKEYTFLIFICGLFNDAVSISNYMTSNDRIIMINEFEKIWREAVVA